MTILFGSLSFLSSRSLWTNSPIDNIELFHQYMANSLARNSPEMDAIKTAVKEAGIFIVLGYSERDAGSIYMAQSFISPEGEIVHHRRKIKPTHVERSLWGDAQPTRCRRSSQPVRQDRRLELLGTSPAAVAVL